MDFKTGLTPGGGAKVGYQALAESAGFDPDRGSKRRTWRPSKGELRSAVGELVRCGLLADAGSNRHVGLVFFCCLASVDKSVKNMNDTGTTPRNSARTLDEQHGGIGDFNSLNNGLSVECGARTLDEPPMNNTKKTPMNDKHQYNNTTTLNKKAAAVTPTRVRVDGCPVVSALRCCFSDARFQAALESPKCGLMVGQWVRHGVTGEDVGEVYRAVQVRTTKSFGPMYLAGPMDDLLAERNGVVERVAEVDELKDRRDEVQLEARRRLVRPRVAEIVASPVGVYVHGAGMVMESDLVYLGLMEIKV
jgi:hypothetical protein